MVESHLPLFVPCTTYGALLDCHSVASSKYFQAVSELLLLAGKQNRAGFGEAKRYCEICLRNCKGTAAAMRTHKAAHGC